MDELIDFYGKPRAIRMDNGPEMTSDLFVSWAEEHGIELRFIQPGKPNQNAYVERFNKSVRTEVLNAWLFHSLEHAQEVIEDWREDYNGIRGHESLGNHPRPICQGLLKPKTLFMTCLLDGEVYDATHLIQHTLRCHRPTHSRI